MIISLNKDCSGSCDSVNREDFEKQFFQKGAFIGIDTTTNYQLMFKHLSGQKETIGADNAITVYKEIDQTEEPKKENKPAKEKAVRMESSASSKERKTEMIRYPTNGKVYPGYELFQKLLLDSAIIARNTALTSFPEAMGQNDQLNAQWVPMLSDEYLILRYVNKYPFDKTTIYSEEHTLYFRKVK